jgi:chromosome segregation ATPase
MEKKERRPTLEEVIRARELLREQGKKVTRRAILAIAGGSPNVLQEHMNTLEEIDRRAAPATLGIPEHLERSIVAAMAEAVERRTSRLQETVALLTEDLEETSCRLDTARDEVARMEREVESRQDQALEQRIELERKLSAAQQRTRDLEKDLAALKEALQTQRLAFEQERKELAAELRRAEAARAEAEKRAAVLEVILGRAEGGTSAP